MQLFENSMVFGLRLENLQSRRICLIKIKRRLFNFCFFVFISSSQLFFHLSLVSPTSCNNCTTKLIVLQRSIYGYALVNEKTNVYDIICGSRGLRSRGPLPNSFKILNYFCAPLSQRLSLNLQLFLSPLAASLF